MSSWSRAASAPRTRPPRSWSSVARRSCSSRSVPAPATAASRRCATGPTTTCSGPRSTPNPAFVDSLATATPVSEHVKVDAELHGCPISPEQLREVLVSVAVGRRPQIREESVCIECKRRGAVCVMVAQGMPVPRAGHPERLWRPVSDVRPRLLRLLRPAGAGKRRLAGPDLPAGGREGQEVSRLFSGFTAGPEPSAT